MPANSVSVSRSAIPVRLSQVVVDIDPVYSLSEPSPDELAVNDELRAAPWYHVVMEDDNGLPVHTYG